MERDQRAGECEVVTFRDFVEGTLARVADGLGLPRDAYVQNDRISGETPVTAVEAALLEGFDDGRAGLEPDDSVVADPALHVHYHRGHALGLARKAKVDADDPPPDNLWFRCTGCDRRVAIKVQASDSQGRDVALEGDESPPSPAVLAAIDGRVIRCQACGCYNEIRVQGSAAVHARRTSERPRALTPVASVLPDAARHESAAQELAAGDAAWTWDAASLRLTHATGAYLWFRPNGTSCNSSLPCWTVHRANDHVLHRRSRYLSVAAAVKAARDGGLLNGGFHASL